jgi:hypothetical protein
MAAKRKRPLPETKQLSLRRDTCAIRIIEETER